MLGHRYPDGYLANPKNWRTRCSLAIQSSGGTLLVDCSPEMRLQLVREGIYDIDAVIITHTHADHVMGMDDLRSICMKTGRPMQVFTLKEYMADIKRIFPYAFQEFPPGIMVPKFDLIEIEPELNLIDLTVKTFVVQHGALPCIGIRVGNFAYITDVSEIPESVRAGLTGLDVLVLDAVRYRPHPNHFHFDQALQVAREIGAKRTVLTHLSHDYDHDVTSQDLPDGVELAYDGQRFEI
jgi:phosphoribosyl 1,2-cyclic phosphate phosphodiesterase